MPQAPSGLFRPWVNHEIGSWPEAVGMGDLNGDGRRDIALVTSFYFDPANDYHVFVYLQTASGSLAPPVKYALPDAYSGNRSLDVGDVTGDGRDDVVVGSGTAILVLRQNASGTLDAYVPYATDDSTQIKIGDFNHDGRQDVAGIDWGTADVAVYLQNTSGTLDPPTSYPAPHGGWDELEAGDVNNDGLDDIVVMSGQGFGANLNVLLQLPAGGFAPPAPYDLPVNELTSGAEVADLNGDGRKDVVVTYGGNQPAFIGIFPQNTLGTLNASFSLASYDIPEPAESADLDANGRADLAVLHGGWMAMGIYQQNTSGTLGLEALEPIPYASHYTPQGIAIGDVSGDGRPDVAIADYNYGLVVVYQKSPYDLGVTMEGPATAVTGSNVSYELRVKNHGSNAYSGGVVTDTPSAGLQFVSSQPAGACIPASGTVSCSLPSLQPGQETLITLVMAGISTGAQVNQATVSGPYPDGYLGDNSATVSTQFLGSCQERILDGGFEQGLSSPWGQFSTNFGTPLCTTFDCGTGGGTALPRSGLWWGWFGGIGVFEQGSLTQNVMLPLGTARLRLFLWIGARSGNGSDFLRVLLGGNQVFAVTESTPAFGAYTQVDLDVSAFANGGTHQLRIESTTFGPNVTNFSVDDVSLEWCPFPTLAVSDVAAVAEGNAGSTNALFSVSLSGPVPQQVTVNWATGNPASGVAATAGSDYTPGAGALTFPPGTVSVPLAVPVLGDLLDEFDERFAVNLATPAGAVLGDASGEATIVDDDPLPSLSLSDTTVVEGHTGTVTAPLTVTLTPASGRAVSGTYATTDGSAVAGQDYTATSASFTVPAGSTAAQVTVPVLGDVVDETDETFSASLSAPDFAVLGDPLGVVTIDDDDGPSLTITDATTTEGNAGTSPASFTLTLSAASPQTVTVDYTTAAGTATAVSDFIATAGSVTFPPSSTGSSVTVQVVGDVLDEPNEQFSVVLSNAVDALAADTEARGIIVDDDGGTLTLSGELSHGAEQWRTLAAPATRDVFVLARPAWSSFEVLLDGASGDLGAGAGPNLRRLAPDLSTILQNSDPAGTGPARRLSVRNEQAVPAADYIEVTSAGCSTDCGADDVYRIRARETTLSAPRFNNGGGQVTVVILQNRTNLTVSGTLRFWSAAGALFAESPYSLGPTQSLALNSAGIAALAGRSGTVTATHDGPYASLVGKAVAIEPATGFAFDTPFEVRRR